MFLGAAKTQVKTPAPEEVQLPEPPVLTKPVPVPTSTKRLAVYVALGLVAAAVLWVAFTRKRD